MTVAAVFVGTFLLGLVACRTSLRLVLRIGLWDIANERSSHEGTVARGGGIGILLALVPGAAAALLLLRPEGTGTVGVAALAGAVALVFVVGFLDDRRGAGPWSDHSPY